MYSLLIDTHDVMVTIVLYKDGKVLEEIHKVSNNEHSVMTLPSIVEVLENYDLFPNSLSEIFVVPGPGSFTGERIAVTIAKTMAYVLNIPIKVIDALLIQALNVDSERKVVSIVDRNGAFVGVFDKDNKAVCDYAYYSKSEYEEFIRVNKVSENVVIDYELVYEYLKGVAVQNAHEVKPLYVKGIKVLNGK